MPNHIWHKSSEYLNGVCVYLLSVLKKSQFIRKRDRLAFLVRYVVVFISSCHELCQGSFSLPHCRDFLRFLEDGLAVVESSQVVFRCED